MNFINTKEEYADQYALTLNISENSLITMLTKEGKPSFKNITIEFLKSLGSHITSTRVCRTIHPSGRTYSKWMKEAGFKEVYPTHSGRSAAGKLYDYYSNDKLSMSIENVDSAIKSTVKVVIGLEAPIDTDPMITAVK